MDLRIPKWLVSNGNLGAMSMGTCRLLWSLIISLSPIISIHGNVIKGVGSYGRVGLFKGRVSWRDNSDFLGVVLGTGKAKKMGIWPGILRDNGKWKHIFMKDVVSTREELFGDQIIYSINFLTRRVSNKNTLLSSLIKCV